MKCPELIPRAKADRDDVIVALQDLGIKLKLPDHPVLPDLSDLLSESPVDHPVDVRKGDQRTIDQEYLEIHLDHIVDVRQITLMIGPDDRLQAAFPPDSPTDCSIRTGLIRINTFADRSDRLHLQIFG